MIPDLKQQIAELQKQKTDLENRLQEETAKNKGNFSTRSHSIFNLIKIATGYFFPLMVYSAAHYNYLSL